MAMYSTLFVAEPASLEHGFRHWLDPDDRWDGHRDLHAGGSVASYPSYLEERIPAFVQGQVHWCSKNLSSVELNPLIRVVTEIGSSELESAILFPERVSAILEAFPVSFGEKLQRAGEFAIRQLAAKWAAVMSTPQFTHSVSGVRVEDDWTSKTALALLQPIVDLLRKRTDHETLYLLVEY